MARYFRHLRLLSFAVLLCLPATCMAQDSLRMVIISTETRVPVRDVTITTDDGQRVVSRWDGTFALHRGFHRADFMHLSYERRYMFAEEMQGDTIYLIPYLNALNEVVVWGHAHANTTTFNVLSPTDAQLMQANPNANLVGLVAPLVKKLFGGSTAKKRRKQKRVIDNY